MNGKVIQSRLDAFRGPPSFFHMGRHAVEPIGCLKQFAADIVRLCSPGKSPDFAGLLSVKRAVACGLSAISGSPPLKDILVPSTCRLPPKCGTGSPRTLSQYYSVVRSSLGYVNELGLCLIRLTVSPNT